MTSRGRALMALALLVGPLVTGCSGIAGGNNGTSAGEVLAAAKRKLDHTSGVHLVVTTDNLPDGVSGVLHAEGVGTHAPAFKGELTVAASGVTAQVATVAVHGAVYAKLPFTTTFSRIDPGDYGAPDPAVLMSPTNGVSALLTAAREPHRGGRAREGKQVLTEYTGTVPSRRVERILPSAPAGDTFTVTFRVTDDHVLRALTLAGPFYPGSDDVSYTISLDRYGASPQITAP